MKKLTFTLLMVLSIVSVTSAASHVAPAVTWDFRYEGDILPGVAGSVTDNNGTGIANFTSSGAVTTATSKVFLGTGADAGTLFIDDLNGGGGNNILWAPGYTGGAVTLYARMAMLEDTTTNNTPFYIGDGISLLRYFMHDTDISAGSSSLVLDFTVMRDFWIRVPGDGSNAQIWIENAAEASGWSFIDDSHVISNSTGRILLGDIFSSTDSKQQWDFAYWKVGEAIAVPEPVTIGLLGAGCLTLLRRRRSK